VVFAVVEIWQFLVGLDLNAVMTGIWRWPWSKKVAFIRPHGVEHEQTMFF
jgi:hypothetical protein